MKKGLIIYAIGVAIVAIGFGIRATKEYLENRQIRKAGGEVYYVNCPKFKDFLFASLLSWFSIVVFAFLMIGEHLKKQKKHRERLAALNTN